MMADNPSTSANFSEANVERLLSEWSRDHPGEQLFKTAGETAEEINRRAERWVQERSARCAT